MAVYRESKRSNTRLWLLLVAAVVLLGGLVWLVLQAARPAAGPADSPRAALDEMASGLDVFLVEYPKLARGEPSGASGALQRVQQTFSANRAALIAVDPVATANMEAALGTLQTRAEAKDPVEQVKPVVDEALSAIRLLRGS